MYQQYRKKQLDIAEEINSRLVNGIKSSLPNGKNGSHKNGFSRHGLGPQFETDSTVVLDLKFRKGQHKFAIDIGGSAIKIVFAKELPGQPQNGATKKYTIEVKVFPREELHEAGLFIKEYLPDLVANKENGGETPILYATGVGANQFTERVNKSLHVKLSVLDELSVFVTTLRYMASHLSKQDFLYKISPEIYAEIDGVFEATKVAHDAWSQNGCVNLPLTHYSTENKFWQRPEENLPADIPFSKAIPDSMYPCLMVPLGSALTIVKVPATGQSDLVGFSPRCGRMFLGVGQLLTGVKTFEELLKLAINGDSSALDQTAVDVSAASSGGSEAYNEGLRNMKNMVLYAFGKSVSTDLSDWKKEDLARCLLRNVLEDIAMEVAHQAREHNIEQVFFVGSLTNSKFMREEMARVIGFRNVFNPTDKTRFEFIRYGGHLGAIGALLNGCSS